MGEEASRREPKQPLLEGGGGGWAGVGIKGGRRGCPIAVEEAGAHKMCPSLKMKQKEALGRKKKGQGEIAVSREDQGAGGGSERKERRSGFIFPPAFRQWMGGGGVGFALPSAASPMSG